MARKRRMPSPSASRPPGLRLPPKPVLSALVWAPLLAGLAYGLRAADTYASQADVQPTRLEWSHVPSWLEGDLWRHVVEGIERGEHLYPPEPILHPETNILDERVCPWVHWCVEQSPWVNRVEKVTKLRDGRVRVYAEFRRPFGAVERDGICYLIDEHGVRLPTAWRAEFDLEHSPLRIRGVRSGAPPVGQRWMGSDVQAGLKLITFLELNARDGKVPFLHELHAIDVSGFDERIGGLRIITLHPRSYIHWGHVPGEGYGVDASAELKLDSLRGVYDQYGTVVMESSYCVHNAPEITLYRNTHQGP